MPRLVDPVVLPGTWGSLPQPTIVGEGITLRPWASLDAEFLEQVYADPVIQQWHVRSLTFGEAHEWILERTRRWVTETAADWAVTVEGHVLAGSGSAVSISKKVEPKCLTGQAPITEDGGSAPVLSKR